MLRPCHSSAPIISANFFLISHIGSYGRRFWPFNGKEESGKYMCKTNFNQYKYNEIINKICFLYGIDQCNIVSALQIYYVYNVINQNKFLLKSNNFFFSSLACKYLNRYYIYYVTSARVYYTKYVIWYTHITKTKIAARL